MSGKKDTKDAASNKAADVPAPNGSTPAVDVHHGHGGMYVVVDGGRQLVERTSGADDLNNVE